MQAYAVASTPRASCPCSPGPVGSTTEEVSELEDLVRSRAAASIVRWPGEARRATGGARNLLWLRKFVGASMANAAAFPACVGRTATLARPCDVPAVNLKQPVPPNKLRGRRPLNALNRTLSSPAFWLAFDWSTQFAHWTLEHLPRMWYYLQLCRLLPSPPLLVVPRRLASWQSAVLRALPQLDRGSGSASSSAKQRPLAAARLLALEPPHYFSVLYVPGMLAHIGMLWTPQAVHMWDRLRRLANQPPSHGSAALLAAAAAGGGAPSRAAGGGRRLYALRAPGGRSAGGSRVLREQASLAAGLRAMGFAPLRLETLPLAGKVAALSKAEVLVVECGSSLANAMFLPRGVQLVVLCMRDHTSSRGCYGQLLASRYTRAAVHTLGVGEAVDAAGHGAAAALTWQNRKNNVQPHSGWTLHVPQTLAAIASLVRLGGKGGGGHLWPPVPTDCDAATASGAPKRARPASLSATGATAPSTSRPPPAHEWWRLPSEAAPATAARQHAANAASRSRIFSLLPCRGAPWAAPRCWELVSVADAARRAQRRTRRGGTEGASAQQLEWRTCSLEAHCTSWRWCIKEANTNWTAYRGAVQDRYVDCEQHVA